MGASDPRAFVSHRRTTTGAWRLPVIWKVTGRELREAFGNTLSDEFVEGLLGKLMELLRPNPFDKLRWR